MKKLYIGFLLIIIIIVSTIYFINKSYKEKLKENLNNINWINENIDIVDNDNYGNNVYTVDYNENINIYNLLYQQVVSEKITDLMSNNYTIENPLVIYNPYGTNNLGVNIYFNTNDKMEISYTVSVNDDKIKDYSQTLNNDSNDNFTSKHSYQIIGLVPGYENTVTLKGVDSEKNEIESKFIVDMRNVKINSDTVLESVKGSSSYELTNGLFVLFGLDKAFNANTYIYDNEGVIRADLVINDYRSDRIIFKDEKMYYSYDTNKIGVINRLGQIEKTYELDGYSMHHDYVFDEYNNKLLILVNSKKEEDKTIEDLIISLDLESGEIKEVVDMKDLLPSIYKTAKMPESGVNTYGGKGLDWIHLNSLSIINNTGDIVVSARETSTIIYIEDIYNIPKIKYMIADPFVYEDTIYNDLVLEKIGNFVNQAGQHTITYVSDNSLEEGQYYLEMYNNNYGASNTREDFPWDKYEGVGTFAEGENSKYYKYLVDEKNKTYKLVEEFNVAYSSIVSSVQDIEDNHVTSSGKSNCYAEYDKDGILIKQYNYTSTKYAYRVFKYDFENVWFKK